jgi:hypothetical protein
VSRRSSRKPRRLTTRRRRPGMLLDFLTKLHDGVAGTAGERSNPGASARSR